MEFTSDGWLRLRSAQLPAAAPRSCRRQGGEPVCLVSLLLFRTVVKVKS